MAMNKTLGRGADASRARPGIATTRTNASGSRICRNMVVCPLAGLEGRTTKLLFDFDADGGDAALQLEGSFIIPDRALNVLPHLQTIKRLLNQ